MQFSILFSSLANPTNRKHALQLPTKRPFKTCNISSARNCCHCQKKFISRRPSRFFKVTSHHIYNWVSTSHAVEWKSFTEFISNYEKDWWRITWKLFRFKLQTEPATSYINYKLASSSLVGRCRVYKRVFCLSSLNIKFKFQMCDYAGQELAVKKFSFFIFTIKFCKKK